VTTVVRLSGVTVLREGARILDSVSWIVSEGERWVILGPNGAGKTTLLQVVAARLHPTSGTAELLDEELGAVDVFELRPRIGLASAALAEGLPGEETVRDVVVTAAWGVTGRWKERYEVRDEVRALTLMAQLGVSHLARRRFGTLSEGERKRVQIARALMTDPELLLLDEPAAGVDLVGREDLVARLGQMAQDPDAPVSVMVTHHLEEIPVGTTHALLMRAGRIQAAGPISEVLTDTLVSRAFGLPLSVMHENGRWFARTTLDRPGSAR
jgi:iron complex transport system ATP-binding protein